jgi:hypothetical protein
MSRRGALNAAREYSGAKVECQGSFNVYRYLLAGPENIRVAFSFWRDANGNSPARAEFNTFLTSHKTQTLRVMAHMATVEAARSLNSYPLSQAQREPGVPPTPALFWWDANGLGAFYLYDGVNLAVVHMGIVSNPPTYGSLLTVAQGRV